MGAASTGRCQADLDAVFAAGGALGAQLGRVDWSTHPIGPPPRWPAGLRSAVAMMLASRAQIALFWGPEFYTFYNDAYAPVVGEKHPRLLAQPARRHYPELWDKLEPLLNRVINTGEAFAGRDHPFPLERHGYLEETYFDVSFDPVRGADGTVDGVLCIVSETTGRVVGERRLRALRDLGVRLGEALDETALAAEAVGVLAEHPRDLPFSLLYLGGEGAARLVGHSGVPADPVESGAARAIVDGILADGDIDTVPARHFVARPPGDASAQALVLPVTAGAHAVGALVVGTSSRLALNRDYQGFLELVAAQISQAAARLRAIRQERARADQLRAVTDSAIALAMAQSTAEVVRVAAGHARAFSGAGRVAVTAARRRCECGEAVPTGTPPDLTVPLAGIGGDPLGQIDVWAPASGAGADQSMLTELARLVALRLENTQLYEAEHRIATTLQHSLLPQSLPRVPGVMLASRYLAGSGEADVGGDWYDAVALPRGEIVLVIGDVVGKGVPAAATMGQVRNALRAYLLEGFPPVDAISRLNRLLISLGQQYFATVACVRLDPGTGSLRFASAGHLPPILISPTGEATYLHDCALGPPVGALAEARFIGREMRVEPGTRVLLYTDGLVEDRATGIDAGLRLLSADVSHPADHVEDLLEHVQARAAARVRHDDIAVLAMELTEVHRLTLRLAARPDRLGVLRRRLEYFLSAHGVPENDLFDLVIAVSEAAANAIEHPVDPAESVVHVTVDINADVVDVTVRDTGQWREQVRSAVRGRGLSLIGALAELDVRRDGGGTTLVLRRRLTRPPGRFR